LPHQLRESVCLGRLQCLGLSDQVLITRGVAPSHQVNRDRCSRCAVVGRGELVNDGRDVGCGVLRGLRGFSNLAWDQDFDGNGHGISLI